MTVTELESRPELRPHEHDALLTIQEVADTIRVPVTTLRFWRGQGIGPPGFRVGRSLRYWRNDVFDWLDDMEHCPQAAERGLPPVLTRERE